MSKAKSFSKVAAEVCEPVMKVNAQHCQATVDGVVYQWHGGFGGVLFSRERMLKKHDLRMIGNVIFKVAKAESCGFLRAPLISWVPAESQGVDAEWLRSFKKAFFGCDRD